jgi:DNA replication protein DnaC
MAEWHGAQYWRNQSKDERTLLAEIPTRLSHARIHNYEGDGDQEAKAKVISWIENYQTRKEDGIGLLFAGKHGSGKSHLAVAAMRAVIRTYRQSGKYITANDYVRALDDQRENNGVLPDSYSEGNLLDYIRTVYDVLVLDDVDAIRQTDFAKREISDLLTSRHNRKLITICTCHDNIANIKFNVTPKFYSLARASSVPIILRSGEYRGVPSGE